MATKKYKLKHTSIMHNKKLYKQGDIIELTEEQANRLVDFVDLVEETKTTTNKNKTAKSKTETESKDDEGTSDSNDGGNDGK